ncbi:conserved exported hypothetical protein [Candidatus Sulfopaludibacter sp. SbA3]|nr:conserved exported hypothetical protein [Candidatus Sulfopaludibacter sp. SbA3]
MRVSALAIVVLLARASGQTDGSPSFEVASVKVSPPVTSGWTMKADGGPGSGDPTRIDYRNISMAILLSRAYDLKFVQLSGPDWIMEEKYDIEARLPPGVTRAQFPQMLRDLLADRFKLQVHREIKQVSGYALVVDKNGSKLKPHVETPDSGKALADTVSPADSDPDGYPVVPLGRVMAVSGGKARFRGDGRGLSWLEGMLSGQVDAPVNDQTGLTGTYDFTMYWSMRQTVDGDGGPDLFTAVQKQLGLKLERKKVPVEMLVIDHLEKVPASN